MLALEMIQEGNILIDNDYYYQPDSDNDPYFVGYSDLDDDTIPPEGIVYGTADTKEDAARISAELIQAAAAYNKSLLKDIYTFTEYLEIRA